MKVANTIIGAFISSILLIGVLFKIMHWPGSSFFIILSSGFLSIYLYLVAVTNIIEHKDNTMLRISNGFGAFSGSILVIGFLFKLMHWPGGSFFTIIGVSLCAIVIFLFGASFLTSKKKLQITSGTFFSIISISILSFGIAVQGPSHSILRSIVNNNQKTEVLISQSAYELDYHAFSSPHAIPYRDATFNFHNHIKSLKSKLYQTIDNLPIEVADTISLESIMGKDNYDLPSHIMGIADPSYPTKIDGLEEFSAITLKEKITTFNNEMKRLDKDFQPIQTQEKWNGQYLDSWESATFYHMPLAQVILILNLIDAEAFSKSNYLITKNHPKTTN